LITALRRSNGADGSTAVFALMVPGQLLVGNVGNSRAVLCRQPGPYGDAGGRGRGGCGVPAVDEGRCPRNASAPSPRLPPPLSKQEQEQEPRADAQLMLLPTAGRASRRQRAGHTGAAPTLVPLPLSRDHVPARADEAARVVAAGGTVARAMAGGKLRLDGDLEVTRAFGDPGFQSRGLTAQPEFELHDLEEGRDAFLILASDGVYEVLTSDEVCAHAWAAWSGDEAAAPRALPPRPAVALPGPATGNGASKMDGDASAASGGNSSRGPGGNKSILRDDGKAAEAPSAAPHDKVQARAAAVAKEAMTAPSQEGLFGSCGDFGGGAALMRLHAGAAAAQRRAAAGGAPEGCRPRGVTAPFTLPQAVASRVAEESYNRGSSDNLAVVCIDVGSAAAAARLQAATGPEGEAAAVLDEEGEEEEDLEDLEDGAACGAVGDEEEAGGEERAAVCGIAAAAGCGGGSGGKCELGTPGTRGAAAAAVDAVSGGPGLSEALAAAAGLATGGLDGGGAVAKAALRSPGTCVLLRRASSAEGAQLPAAAGGEASGVLEPAGGVRGGGGGRLAGRVAVVCDASDHTYELTHHLVDAPVLPAHAHVWPLAQFPLNAAAAAGG
jgi:hypothetical protein